MSASLVGSEMCIRDRGCNDHPYEYGNIQSWSFEPDTCAGPWRHGSRRRLRHADARPEPLRAAPRALVVKEPGA
eukprot:10479802-Alexandrium_andersonii.AAC.1